MENNKVFTEETHLKAAGGMAVLLLNTVAMLAAIAVFVLGAILDEAGNGLGNILIIVGGLLAFIICPVIFFGLKVVKPNEALVLTLFGKYIGTLKGEGFYYVNPFCTAVNPTKGVNAEPADPTTGKVVKVSNEKKRDNASGKAISLKVLTLSNDKQKVNDKLGNPIEIGVVVIWRVVNAAMAVFNVDNYIEFLSIQADSSLRNIVRLYPYDINDDIDGGDEMSLRGSSREVALKLRDELQSKVSDAGLEIVETRITHLAYAPEIAAAMLQRQQASAIIDARKLIVEGAVGMVQMALTQLSENEIVDLDNERRAQMVSNLLVVLCGSREAQPIVNSGSIY